MSTRPPAGLGSEKWRGVQDDRGVVSAYGIPVDERFAERLAEVWSHPTEKWTAVEFTGTSRHPNVAAECAFWTPDIVRSVEIPGLIAHPGIQRPLLTALDPRTAGCLGVPSSPLPAGLLERVDWPVSSVFATQT